MSRIDSILSGSLIFRDKGTYLSEIKPGTDKITVTGSLQITGSNLLLNGKDIGNAIAVLESGQGADQVKFGSILLYTASISEWTASIKDYTSSLATTASNTFIGTQTISGSVIPEGTSIGNGLYDLGSQTAPFRDLYLSTASLNFVKDGQVVVDLTGEDNAVRVGNLLLGTSSISIVNNQGVIVDTIYSVQLDGSGEVIEVDKQSLPLGIVSSSAQIHDLGFLSSSISGIVSRSAQISDLGFITASKFEDLHDIPQGIISSSTQIDDLFNLDGIVSASNGAVQLQNTDLQVTGSVLLNFNGVSNYFKIDINGEEKVKVNEEGIFSLAPFISTPTAVRGGIFFGDDDNLYLGVNE